MRAPGARREGAKFAQGLFLALDGNGKHIASENSLGNLGAIGYRNLQPEQVRSLIRLGLVSYNTLVPFPSVATESRMYDPRNQIPWHIHSSGSWGYQWRYLSDSYRWHGQRSDLLDQDAYLCEIIADLAAAAYKQAFLPHKPEFVNPETAEPQRPQVKGFNMSGQVNLMRHHNHLGRLTEDKNYFDLVSKLGRIVDLSQLEPADETIAI